MVNNADRALYFDEGPRALPRLLARGIPTHKEKADHAGGILMGRSFESVRMGVKRSRPAGVRPPGS